MDAVLNEPSGASLFQDLVYIADTNNHRICTANVFTGEVKSLDISSIPAASAKKISRITNAKANISHFSITKQAGASSSIRILYN